jgi:hypothetical protein
MKHFILPAVVALVLTYMAVPSSASPVYLTVYGGPGANAVNAGGTAVGAVDGRAVRWNPADAGITVLGALENQPPFSNAYAINAAGTAVGYALIVDSDGEIGGERAVRWDASGTAATELGRLGSDEDWGPADFAVAINNAGTAVGYAAGPAGGSRAVRWDASGTAATPLGSLGPRGDGYTHDQARAVNAAGTAVGFATRYGVAGTGQFATRWDASGAATALGRLGTNSGGGAYATAYAINAAGTAVGSSDKYDAAGTPKGSRAVRWNASGTAATELGILGTDATGLTNGSAIAINDAGTAVGFVWKYDAAGVDKGQRAVRWDPSGTAVTELGHLGGSAGVYIYSMALAINAGGIVVGYDQIDTASGMPTPIAVYWGPNGLPVNLNTLIDPASGWTLTQAQLITDTNWIAGIGTFDPDGPGGQRADPRGFLLHVPEPDGLAALSLGGLALLRRRRVA